MSEIQSNLVKSNNEFAKTFDKGHLPLPPGKKYLVLTCMDARIDPCAAFGISLGDAHVIRNAGASARDALRSIIISQQLLGTREILLVKHTGCGMLNFTNEVARGAVRDKFGERALAREKDRGGVDTEALDFLPFADLEEAVREDLHFLQNSGVVLAGGPDGEEGRSSGWIYEVETGKVRSVY